MVPVRPQPDAAIAVPAGGDAVEHRQCILPVQVGGIVLPDRPQVGRRIQAVVATVHPVVQEAGDLGMQYIGGLRQHPEAPPLQLAACGNVVVKRVAGAGNPERGGIGDFDLVQVDEIGGASGHRDRRGAIRCGRDVDAVVVDPRRQIIACPEFTGVSAGRELRGHRARSKVELEGIANLIALFQVEAVAYRTRANIVFDNRVVAHVNRNAFVIAVMDTVAVDYSIGTHIAHHVKMHRVGTHQFHIADTGSGIRHVLAKLLNFNALDLRNAVPRQYFDLATVMRIAAGLRRIAGELDAAADQGDDGALVNAVVPVRAVTETGRQIRDLRLALKFNAVAERGSRADAALARRLAAVVVVQQRCRGVQADNADTATVVDGLYLHELGLVRGEAGAGYRYPVADCPVDGARQRERCVWRRIGHRCRHAVGAAEALRARWNAEIGPAVTASAVGGIGADNAPAAMHQQFPVTAEEDALAIETIGTAIGGPAAGELECQL